MKSRLIGAVLLLFVPLSLFAKKPAPPPIVVPTADATLKAMGAILTDSKARQSDLSKRARALRDRLTALKAKAKVPKVDLAEQLSKEDMDEYNLLSAQVHYLENAALIEVVRQKHLEVVKDIYQATFFAATMATQYVAEKGELDDGFDDYCLAKAKEYNLGVPVSLLFNAENYVVYQMAPAPKGKKPNTASP